MTPDIAPGLILAALRSGAGKTTLALGAMRALTRRGLRVAPAKCGPDYIDPAFHAAATGRASINLDGWAMDASLLFHLCARAAEQADVVIAEGAMGLFDGAPPLDFASGAAADIAGLMRWPVVLILDVSGQGQSAAVLARGAAAHDPRVSIAGVVLNKVASERHRKLCSDAIEALGVPVFGALPRVEALALPERHLGLVQAAETEGLAARLDGLADFVETNVDLDAILACAAGGAGRQAMQDIQTTPPGQRIAIARDAAFSFHYPHLLEGWREAGAELFFFSPLADEPPPEACDFCWLAGGYPELHAGRIAAAQVFLEGLRCFARDRPVHGECGGYMALGDGLVDAVGARHAMAGLLRLETSFSQRKLTLGYRRATLLAPHALGASGAILYGHEFHYAVTLREEGEAFAEVRDAYSQDARRCGLRRGTVSGSFFHLLATKKGATDEAVARV
ncbi:cobyrinate a,c-diamide synthase [Methylocystis bryophila]|uniref:Hydrogenobyrinate a,c-diamide synthase n=1 Tax=Methylocystis bryophila TaxID=655015 RepID=A0A1W6MSU7_9HYPH|nr:cobyrinate a,c-diamide synthase [Methylocystis bryophila]ARN80569.1 cobyrinic acid a,c-diamide synthase [Methylocystis bryophila]BDV40619.1 hydrogenobyrinate a,c-diamide synthase [Methylocystis bryophila]